MLIAAIRLEPVAAIAGSRSGVPDTPMVIQLSAVLPVAVVPAAWVSPVVFPPPHPLKSIAIMDAVNTAQTPFFPFLHFFIGLLLFFHSTLRIEYRAIILPL